VAFCLSVFGKKVQKAKSDSPNGDSHSLSVAARLPACPPALPPCRPPALRAGGVASEGKNFRKVTVTFLWGILPMEGRGFPA
jgi:hypothetical protein